MADDKLDNMRQKARQFLNADRAGQSKPMTLKDYHRETLLRGEIPGAIENTSAKPVKTHAQEQAELKAALKSAISTSDDNKEDDLFSVRKKTEDEVARDEQEYRQWLLETLKSDKTVASSQELQKWSEHMSAKTQGADGDEQFLLK